MEAAAVAVVVVVAWRKCAIFDQFETTRLATIGF